MDWKNNIVKMTILFNASYIFKAMSIKTPMTFFTNNRIKNQNLQPQKTLNNQSNPENKSGGIILPDFKV